jgi:hypothetical protein
MWALQPIMNLGLRFYNFLIKQTVGRTPWAGDQPTANPLPTQDNTNRIYSDIHPCLEWYSNPWPQCLSGWRQFIPWTERPLWSAVQHNADTKYCDRTQVSYRHFCPVYDPPVYKILHTRLLWLIIFSCRHKILSHA